MLSALRAGVHRHLGCGSFAEYVERLLGYSSRATREKVRVAEALEGLEGLPLSARALEQGKLSWCAVRELTRVATAETEAAWLERAQGKTTRELEQLVASKRPGDLPPRPGEAPPPRRHVLRFEVSPETFAIFEQATQSLRRAAGGGLDDDALLLTMARQVLGTPTDVGRSSYRISYELCPACRQGGQVVGGELIAVSADVLDMAACDGEHVGFHSGPSANENHSPAQMKTAEAPEPPPDLAHVGRESSGGACGAVAADTMKRTAPIARTAALESTGTIQSMTAAVAPKGRSARQPAPPAVRHAIDDAAQTAPGTAHVGHAPSDDASNVVGTDSTESAATVRNPATTAMAAPAASRTLRPAPAGGHHAVVEALAPGTDAAHVGHAPSDDATGAADTDTIGRADAVAKRAPLSSASVVPRARQAVPPSMRRAVLARDRQRCQVPGCTHTQFVDVHHVRPRSDGGQNTLANLITLCTAHHRAVHRGELVIEGSAAEPRFRHADGTPYGHPIAAPPVDASTKVFAALRHLGFREREVNAVLAELRNEAFLRDAPANVLLREALCRIRTGR